MRPPCWRLDRASHEQPAQLQLLDSHSAVHEYCSSSDSESVLGVNIVLWPDLNNSVMKPGFSDDRVLRHVSRIFFSAQ